MSTAYYRSDQFVKTVLGAAIAGAHVYWCTQPANVPSTERTGGPTPQATLYADPYGILPLSQPVDTDGFGHAYAYMASEIYTVAVYNWGNLQNMYADQNVASSGGGTPGGNPNDIQFNNSGIFGGSDSFTFVPVSGSLIDVLTVGNCMIYSTGATTAGFAVAQGSNLFLNDNGANLGDYIVVGPYIPDDLLENGGITLHGGCGNEIILDAPNVEGDNVDGGIVFNLPNSSSAFDIYGYHGAVTFTIRSNTINGGSVTGLGGIACSGVYGIPPIIYTYTNSSLSANAFNSPQILCADPSGPDFPDFDFVMEVKASSAIIVAADTSSTLPSLTLSWTDPGGIDRTVIMIPTDTGNTTDVLHTASQIIHVQASTQPTITTEDYDSVGATDMAYTLAVVAMIYAGPNYV